MDNRWKTYKIFLWSMLFTATLGLMAACFFIFTSKIPKKIYLNERSEGELSFDMPVTVVTALSKDVVNESAKTTGLTNQIKLKTGTKDSYWMQINLFGMIPVREVDVSVMSEKRVYPVGIPVGIYLHTGGVLVLDCGEIVGSDRSVYAPAKHVLKEGDYIEAVNGEKVEEKEEVIALVEQSEGKDLIFTIRREGAVFDVTVTPKLTAEGNYKIGVWVSDSAQGIGTLSYVDENGNFAALGHGINSAATDRLLELGYGALYETNIVSIKKGKRDDPGELTGLILLKDEELMGDILSNTRSGIFGNIQGDAGLEKYTKEPVEISYKEQVKKGKAQILCKIDGEPEYYDVDIIAIDYDSGSSHKDMEMVVTDERLIKKTGGIVQGMSGAPILQDGRMIGVVTHVLVKDPTKGYGIFIENMMAG